MDKTPIILTGPPGCGKSYWIQKYAEQIKKQLAHFQEVEQTVSALRPTVDKLAQKQEIQDKINLLKWTLN